MGLACCGPGREGKHGSPGGDFLGFKSDQARDGYVIRFDASHEVSLLRGFRGHSNILATECLSRANLA
jgi:hypothetical protein